MHLMTMYQDQIGGSIRLSTPARRIVSVVPSQTELLSALGLEEQVVGVTKFCIYPHHWQSSKTIVGGTKNISGETICRLEPDLVLANKEENTQADIVPLQEKFPVWVSDVTTLRSAYDMIRSVGEMTDRLSVSNDLVSSIDDAFSTLPVFQIRRALYLIWRKPWMTAGVDTFINEMMNRAGFANVIQARRYPELTADHIRALNPEIVLLSSEPFPFREIHVAEVSAIVPAARVMLVDGEMFSWYGARMQYAPAYFRKLNGLV